MASMSAFNRWLEDDWGFDHQGRILAAPMLSLADPEAAAAEVDSLLDRGARIIHIRPAPVPGPNGTSRSLGDKLHDPVWARIAEGDEIGKHTSELPSLMRISYAVFCMKKQT